MKRSISGWNRSPKKRRDAVERRCQARGEAQPLALDARRSGRGAVIPDSAIARRSVLWPPLWPESDGLPLNRACGLGSWSGVGRRHPDAGPRVASAPSQRKMSRPRYRRGARPARPDRQVDLAPGVLELLGELAAGLGAADDEDRAGRQVRLAAVDEGVDGVIRVRQRRGDLRDVRAMEAAGRDDDPLRLERALVRVERGSPPPAAARAARRASPSRPAR